MHIILGSMYFVKRIIYKIKEVWVLNKQCISKPLLLKKVKITDNFWKKEMELVRKEVIPYQWEALNDRVEGAAPSFCMRNYKRAGEIKEQKKVLGSEYKQEEYPLDTFETLPDESHQLDGRFYGFVFQDSDFSKWIEAVAYSLSQYPDKQLEQIADEAIDIVCKAQREDGYLDTYYLINNENYIFTNLRDLHELYCFGHLVEAAVAYYEATGKDKLLQAAKKFALFIEKHIGIEEGKKHGYPGHEIAEMALMTLYQLEGDKRFLKLAKYFVDERGKKPYYFDVERGEICKEGEEKYHYHQAHRPVREQNEAVGHAVRGVYLYSGMADVARETEDEELFLSCERLWNSIVNEKMYITGGIGATHLGEAFSFPYDLPNDTAYAETCASIGLVFFARRMLEAKIDSQYSDIMELALYNGVLSGMALDGKSFFYVNPLEVVPEACYKDERKHHVKPIRQKWFGCACCPPNLARLISSISRYAFTENEQGLYIHLYIGGELTAVAGKEEKHISIQSKFPWDGLVYIEVKEDITSPYTIAFRIPSWCNTYSISGIDSSQVTIKDGYGYITKEWKARECITLDFKMEPTIIMANEKVREDIGKVAIKRGPIVYCMEQADNGNNLHLIQIDTTKPLQWKEKELLGEKFVEIKGEGVKTIIEDAKQSSLYRTYESRKKEATTITFIPYYMWNNRGEGEMSVWVREL